MYGVLELFEIITITNPDGSFSINSGSIASIISLVLTIIIFFSIRKIQSFYIFTARVPEVVSDLDEIASSISEYLNDFENNIHRISKELARAQAKLQTLKKKLKDRQSKKPISELIKVIKTYNPNSKDEDTLRQIYLDLYKIIAEIKELQKDHKWERLK